MEQLSALDIGKGLLRRITAAVVVVNVQHGFGIFGGEGGRHVLVLLDALRKPVVTTLHTVQPDPDPVAREILRALFERSAATVGMTPVAREVLGRDYGLDGTRLRVIPHGVPTAPMQDAEDVKARLGFPGRQIVSTLCLFSPGKGIEDVIDALPKVVARFPQVLYLVLGETHPVVRREQGEEYRTRLIRQVQRLGLKQHVKFNNRYLPDDELVQYLMATGRYITPD